VGCYPNVNLLLGEANSQYIAVLNADDWWEPAFLATMVDLLDRAPDALLATCATRDVRNGTEVNLTGLHLFWPPARGSTCPSAEAARFLTRDNPVRTPSVLARAQLYQRVARFDESVPFSADWLMWLRAAAIAPIAVSAETLANYRLHEASMSSDFIKKNLYGVEVLRLSRILTEEWGGAAEPFPGAVREFDSTVSGQLLMDAMRRNQRGDRAGAIAQARLARAIAPSGTRAWLGFAVEKSIALTAIPLLGAFRKPISALALAGGNRMRRSWMGTN
jgi:hypothetical protein